MAVIHQNNFDSLVAGAKLTDWVDLKGSWAVANTRPVSGANTFGSSADGDIAIYTGSPARLDQEVQVDFVVPPGGAIASVRTFMRISLDGTSYYSVRLLSVNNTGYNLQAMWGTPDGQGPIGDFINNALSVVAGDTVHLSSKIVGSTIYATVWKNSDTKPNPQITATSTRVTVAGYPGIGNVFNGASVPAYADNFIYGDTAPAGAPSGAITSQPNPDGQTVGPITFSTSGNPTSAVATFTPDVGTAVQVTATLGSNTGLIPAQVLAPASYTLSITLTNAIASAVLAGNSFVINAIGGNPQPSDAAAPFSVQVTIPLTSLGGASVANLTGLKWAWHDQPTPDLFTTGPTDKGSAEVTDSLGVIVIPLPNSGKTASGQVGHIEITNSDGNPASTYSVFAGPWAVD